MKGPDEFHFGTELRVLEKPGKGVPAMGVLKRAKKQRAPGIEERIRDSDEPFVVLDENSCVVWANDAWKAQVGSSIEGEKLDTLFESGWRYKKRIDSMVECLATALDELDLLRDDPDRGRIAELSKLLFEIREDAIAVQRAMQLAVERSEAAELEESSSPELSPPSTGEFQRYQPTAMVDDVEALLAMERALDLSRK